MLHGNPGLILALQGAIAEALGHGFRQAVAYGIGSSIPPVGFAVKAKHLLQRATVGVGQTPAGELLGCGVDKIDTAAGISGDDGVAQRLQRGLGPFFFPLQPGLDSSSSGDLALQLAIYSDRFITCRTYGIGELRVCERQVEGTSQAGIQPSRRQEHDAQ